MLTILEVTAHCTDYLKKYAVANPRRQAEELVAEALGMSRVDLYIDYSRPLTEAELERLRAWLKRRAKKEPLQYISGAVDFFSCRLLVNPNVLIPRQETEILCDIIAKHLEAENRNGMVLWDVCTGSGAIGIALKKRFPELKVLLSDICPEALAQAKANAAHNNVEVECLLGDLLTPFKEAKADLIVCNPPYIREDEYAGLEEEVRLYEPKKALVSGVTGLEFYASLARILPLHLNSKGKVWFEIGTGQGKGVGQLFSDPCWVRCACEQDWSGHDRFFSLEIE